MNLYTRLSDTQLCFAALVPGRSSTLKCATFHVRPQVSLTVNLREAMESVPWLTQKFDRTEVLATGMATPVPLAEFQEEDAADTWKFCFTHNGSERIFYDSVPATNVVLLYALPDAACRAVEEAFGEVRYTSALTAVVQHFATKGLDVSQGKRVFVVAHERVADVMVFDETRLLALNTYAVRTLLDADYYILNLAQHIGVDVGEAPFFVAGTPTLRDPLASELEKYAAHVYAVNPAAEFNRHPISTNADAPYDMVCAVAR